MTKDSNADHTKNHDSEIIELANKLACVDSTEKTMRTKRSSAAETADQGDISPQQCRKPFTALR